MLCIDTHCICKILSAFVICSTGNLECHCVAEIPQIVTNLTNRHLFDLFWFGLFLAVGDRKLLFDAFEIYIILIISMLFETCEIFGDGFFDAKIKCVADDGVADGNLVKERYALFEVGEIQ